MCSNKEVKDLLLSAVQLGSKTSCSDSLTATASNRTAIPSPQAVTTPLSHDSMVNHHHAVSVPAIPNNTHPLHFQHIDSHIEPTIADHMQNRLEFSHSSHSNKVPIQNQSTHVANANNYQLLLEHFEQHQQSYENHYNSTGVSYSTSLDSQTNSDYDDANHLSAFWDEYVNYEAPQHPYQMNYSDENDYSNHFPSDFHSKHMGNYGIEENYNVLCNV